MVDSHQRRRPPRLAHGARHAQSPSNRGRRKDHLSLEPSASKGATRKFSTRHPRHRTPSRAKRLHASAVFTSDDFETIADAVLVLNAYATRWRIEEFHKTWKTGGCRIEDTQLQARDHIVRFAIISASVAMRIQRLTHLARTSPGEPATIEFNRAEIAARRPGPTVIRRGLEKIDPVASILARGVKL